MKKLITTIYHPKTTKLKMEIVEVFEGGLKNFFFEEDGDYYNKTWCENPLESCKKDAMATLDSKYKGTYYDYDRSEAVLHVCVGQEY